MRSCKSDISPSIGERVGDAVICIRVALAPELSSFHIDNVHLNHVRVPMHVLALGRVIRAITYI
jgi:hypothetical protein